MSGSAAPILVTGATGRHGSTGAHVARRLRAEGKAVRILTEELGRPIAFEPVSPDVWRKDLLRIAEEYPGGVVNTAMAGHIANVGAAVAARGAPPADCSALAGLIDRTPETIREFVRANLANLEVTR